MIENNVVLPAPLGPISAVMRSGGAVSDAPSTAFNPPNQQLTRSTASSGSVMRHLLDRRRRRLTAEKFSYIGKATDDPARHDPDHQHEHGTVDDKIETGRIADQQPRRLSKRFDNQSAGQWPEDRTDAADDGSEQSF